MNQYRAIAFEHYGTAEELKIVKLPIREPKEHEVLVRIRAAGVNPLDWKIRNGEMKFIPGQHFPHLIGSDFAGEVASVGTGIQGLHAGDEVFGWTSAFKGGAYAEHITVDVQSLVAKPKSLSFAQAAAIPTAGTAGLQGLRDVGRLQRGQRVLLNGCTGGVGMFAVPLAKSFGAHVTGVCGTKGVDFAHQMGADTVLDYNNVDVRTLQETFDVIFDLAGRLSFDSVKHLLTPHGIFVDPAPTPAVMAGSVLNNFWHAQKHGILMSKLNCADAKLLADQVERLPITIRIAAEYPLDQAAAAHAAGEKGGGIGKLAVTV